MVKQSPEEIRRQVLEEDAKKDVSIYLAIPIGVTAGVSAIGALCAIICMRAMVYFRHGVDAYWLSCVPFLFPVVTGLFAAYKKQFALLGVHLCMGILTLLLGGFGFGLSVEPIFIDRHDCLPVHVNVPCEKELLSYLYLVSGVMAAGFALLGFILTLFAIRSATKRIARREYQAHLQHLQDLEDKQQELRKQKMAESESKRRTMSVSSTTSNPSPPLLQTVPEGDGPQPEKSAV